jgi:type II secretory pathway pseudopilin PulG
MRPLSHHPRHPQCRPATAGRARGFSLVEAMVSAGIVGVMLVASVNLLSSAARTRVADGNRRTAGLLAQQLMSEILTQPYKDESLLNLTFGPELGENLRTDFDDVDDYKNYMERPPKDHNGLLMTGYDLWKRKVKVTWVSPDTLSESLLDTGLVRVEVTVIDPRGVETTVSALRSERAVPADAQPSGTTWLQFTDVELEVGGDAPRRSVTAVNTIMRPLIK